MSYHSSTTLRPMRDADAVELLFDYAHNRALAIENRLRGNVQAALEQEETAAAQAADGLGSFHGEKFERLVARMDALADSNPSLADIDADPKAWAARWQAQIPKTRGQIRAQAVAALNRRFGAPSPADAKVLAEKYGDPISWGDYICDMADDCGVSYGKAATLFDLLGPDEAFDGFVTGLQDAEGEFE